MENSESTTPDPAEPTGGGVIRILIYVIALILAYAFDCGPAVFYSRRLLINGWPGAVRFVDVVYSPIISVRSWIPLYNDYLRWWFEVSD